MLVVLPPAWWVTPQAVSKQSKAPGWRQRASWAAEGRSPRTGSRPQTRAEMGLATMLHLATWASLTRQGDNSRCPLPLPCQHHPSPWGLCGGWSPHQAKAVMVRATREGQREGEGRRREEGHEAGSQPTQRLLPGVCTSSPFLAQRHLGSALCQLLVPSSSQASLPSLLSGAVTLEPHPLPSIAPPAHTLEQAQRRSWGRETTIQLYPRQLLVGDVPVTKAPRGDRTGVPSPNTRVWDFYLSHP